VQSIPALIQEGKMAAQHGTSKFMQYLSGATRRRGPFNYGMQFIIEFFLAELAISHHNIFHIS
jgi:hypothetical protein